MQRVVGKNKNTRGGADSRFSWGKKEKSGDRGTASWGNQGQLAGDRAIPGGQRFRRKVKEFSKNEMGMESPLKDWTHGGAGDTDKKSIALP